MITFELLQDHISEWDLGIVPEFFSARDPRPAREQLHEHYAHGGGVRPMEGFQAQVVDDSGEIALVFPGDPTLYPIAKARLREEVIYLYECEILAIFQEDGSFIATRVD